MSISLNISSPSSPEIVEKAPSVNLSVSKIKKIAEAIIFGSLAIIGAALLVTGTIASLGTLPIVLTIAATALSGIASLILSRLAILDKPAEVRAEVELESEVEDDAVSYSEEVGEEFLPSITQGENLATPMFQNPTLTSNLAEFLDSRTQEGSALKEFGTMPIYPKKAQVHSTFVEACITDRNNIVINGSPISKTFEAEFAELAKLDEDSEEFDTFKSELRERIIEYFINFSGVKLNWNVDLIKHISTALTSYSAVILNQEMKQLVEAHYQGGLLQPMKDQKIPRPVFSLKFPGNGTAEITITHTVKYSEILLPKEDTKRKLDPPCLYRGKMTITIDGEGKSSIASHVILNPVTEAK